MSNPVEPSDGSFIDGGPIRKVWHKGEWYFSVVDAVAFATDRNYEQARKYWKNLKSEIAKAGSELVRTSYQLKLRAADGKMRMTDVANTELMLRILQEIPGSKTNQVKDWLAHVGTERLQEADISAQKRRQTGDYRRLVASGFTPQESNQWIDKREEGKKARHGVVRVWSEHGVSDPRDFALLTNHVTDVAIGKTATEMRRELAVTSGSLRDHLSVMELTEISVTESLSTGLHINRDSQGKNELAADIEDTRPILDAARPEIEKAFSQKRPKRS